MQNRQPYMKASALFLWVEINHTIDKRDKETHRGHTERLEQRSQNVRMHFASHRKWVVQRWFASRMQSQQKRMTQGRQPWWHGTFAEAKTSARWANTLTKWNTKGYLHQWHHFREASTYGQGIPEAFLRQSVPVKEEIAMRKRKRAHK